MEQSSPLRPTGTGKWSGFTQPRGDFFEPFGNWLLSKPTCTWLAGRGEYVEGALKLPTLGTLRNCWPGLPLSILLNGVMKGKREKGSGALG